MKTKINKQQTIRFKDANLVAKLNEDYLKSKFNSVNEYFNFCLESHLNSQVNTKKHIEEIFNILQDKNLSNDKFEQELLYTLKEIVKNLKKNMSISLRELGLLTRFIFKYPLDENDLDNGKYDEQPFLIQEFTNE